MPTYKSTLINITGQQFNHWLVLGISHKVPTKSSYETYWLCMCRCGTVRSLTGRKVRKGIPKMCKRCTVKHGKTNTPEHRAWINMRYRVNNPNCAEYPDYGGRGVTISERWDSFENFFQDMGRRPSPKHSIERINNDEGYSPENCKWGTWAEQSRNRRSRVLITWDGRTQCVTDWSREIFGRKQKGVLRDRLGRGWSLERAIRTPG